MNRHVLLPLNLLLAAAGFAQTTDTTSIAKALATAQAALDANEQTDNRVKIIERQREIEAEDAAAKAKTTPVVQANASGLLFRSADTAFSIRFRGVVRTSAQWDLNDKNKKTLDQFQNNTVRLGFEGALAKKIGYKIQADFSKGAVALQDAYSDINLYKWAQVRFGKFQVPLGWERFQSPGDLPFFDRALPSSVAPNRDVGVQLSGDLFDGKLNYALAGVNGGVDGSNINGDVNDDKDAYARLWATPGKGSGDALLEGIGFGVGGSYGYHDITLPSYKSAGGATYFAWVAADSARGKGWRIAPQASYTAGSFWVFGEWIRSVEAVAKGATASTTSDTIGTGSTNKSIVYRITKAGNAGAAIEDLGVNSWQAGLSWVVTGEDASEKGVKPRHPLDGSENGGWGALELTGRISGLQIDKKAFPVYADTAKSAKSAFAWAVAANWHLVRGTRLQVSYERTAFEGGDTKVVGKDSKNKDILAVRDRKAENLLSIIASTSF